MKRRRISFKYMVDAAMGKGAFIRTYGRNAWDRLPKWAIMKDGKRAYITREAFLDNLWLAPQ